MANFEESFSRSINIAHACTEIERTEFEAMHLQATEKDRGATDIYLRPRIRRVSKETKVQPIWLNATIRSELNHALSTLTEHMLART